MGLPPGMVWPGWEWWSHLKAADQAAWVSGIGSTATVFFTAFVAFATHFDRRRSSLLKARVIAIEARNPLSRIKIGASIARNEINEMSKGAWRAGPVSLQLLAEGALHGLAMVAAGIEGARPESTVAVVELHRAVATFNEAVGMLRLATEGSEGPESARLVAAQLEARMQRVEAAILAATREMKSVDPAAFAD